MGSPDVHHQGPRYHHGATYGILSQNVRGFRRLPLARESWIAGWKAKIDRHQVAYILLQETHVASHQEAQKLQVMWAQAWGRKPDPARPISFWSVGLSRTAGVAILLNPHCATGFQLSVHVAVTPRYISVESQTTRLVNAYAPNDRSDRERFFQQMSTWSRTDTKQVLVAGDFNCVQDPSRDRVTNGEWGSGPSESPALDELVSLWQLSDCSLVAPVSEGATASLTYWQGEHGARLDRCYISMRERDWIAGTRLVVPHGKSDHLGLVTWLRDPASRPLGTPTARLLYPIRARNAKAMDTAIGQALISTINAASKRQLPWERLLAHITEDLQYLDAAERRRSTRQRKKWERRPRARLRTLADMVNFEAAQQTRKMAHRHRAHLTTAQRTTPSIFRRARATESNQTISRLEVSNDKVCSIANQMSTAWEPLLGHRHATIESFGVGTACRSLFRIPAERKLTSAQRSELMLPITEEEVVRAVNSLGRNKSAGSDRLSNDFYKDWCHLLAPSLVRSFNDIMEGGLLPPSFAKATIVPLRKRGDSPNPMDYRPISLLQSSYKIFTRILAERVQVGLPTIINSDQNGFVRGRYMSDNVHLMQAILKQSYTLANEDITSAPAVVLLDFAKAYDTLDRAFVHHTLQEFGYGDEFVHLVDRLHAGTSAQFLVNGELSDPQPVVSGIRQGCPLAPLLFLIAAETLKHALDQTNGITGITLEGHGVRHTHLFSAFVDDSVVCVQRGDMISMVAATLSKFGDVSGLRVQPTKCHVISLNTACGNDTLGSFPVVAHRTSVRYLGVWLGNRDTTDDNWQRCLVSLRRRLGAVARLTTSIVDRVRAWNAIGVASLAFTGAYFLPRRQHLQSIDQLERQYIWTGALGQATKQGHNMLRDVVTLPVSSLGVGVQDYRAHIGAMAVRHILHWNDQKMDKYWLAVATLLDTTARAHTFPAATSANVASLLLRERHILTIGWKLTCSAMKQRYPVPTILRQATCSIIRHVRGPQVGLQWLTSNKGCITFPDAHLDAFALHQQLLATHTPPEIKSFWSTFPWARNEWITDEHGRPLTKQEFSGIGITSLGELQLCQVGRGSFTFRRPISGAHVIRRASLGRLANWLQVIICNYPSFALGTAGASEERLYSVTHHPNLCGVRVGRPAGRHSSRCGPPIEVVSTSGAGDTMSHSDVLY